MTATAVPRAAVTERLAVRPAWSWRAIAGLLVAGVVLGWQRANQPYADSDVLWAIRAGRDVLSSATIPRTDSYSWTVAGHAWVPNSWGWNVVLGIAYRIGGFSGVAVLGIAVVVMTVLLVGVAARRLGANAAMTVLIVFIVGGLFGLYLYPRPQLIDLPAVLVLLLLVPGAVGGDRRLALRSGAALVGLHVVWMNAHSSALLGPVLVIACGTALVLATRADRWQAATRVVGLAVACALACAATPYGFAPFTHASQVRAASAGLITEWLPVGFATSTQLLGVAALGLAGPAAWFAWRVRRFELLAALVVLGVATATAVRFAPLLARGGAVVGGVVLAAADPEFLAARAWQVVAVVLALVCLARSGDFGRPGVQNDAPELVAQLPSGCRLFNDYGVGGSAELLRRDVPVAIDSRNDLYGRARELQVIRALAVPAAGMAFLRAHDVTCVLAQSDSALVEALRSDPQWRAVDSDSVRTLLVRR